MKTLSILILSLLFTLSANAADRAFYSEALSNTVSSVANATTNTTAGTALDLRKKGAEKVALFISFNSTTNAATSTVVFRYSVSPDSTNWTTGAQSAYSISLTANGTNTVGGILLFDASYGIEQVRRGAIENICGGLITNFVERVGYLSTNPQ